MTGNRAITDEDLHAYIDNELAPDRRAYVAAALAADPALAAQAAAFQDDKRRMAAIFGPIAERPLPPHWSRLIARAQPRAAPRWRFAAAACLALALGGSAATLLSPAGDTILADAASARDGTLVPARVLAVGALPEPGAQRQLLETTLGLKLRAPDLTRFGYHLVAIDIFHAHPAAGLVYKNAQDAELTLYVRRSSGEARFDLLRRGKLRVCIWQDDVVGAVITGEMGAGEMMRIASKAYADLNI